MKKMLLGAALLSSLTTAAQGAAVFTFQPGLSFAGQNVIEDFDDGSYPGLSGGVVQSGSNANGADPNPPGVVPPNNGDPYLTVLGGTSATYTFASPLSAFGFDYGSIDTYNSLELLFDTGPSEVYTGAQLAGPPANGDQSSLATNGRVAISTGDGRSFTGFRLSSTQNSFEIDNIAAVPEPSTWAFMLVGFGAVGYAMRRRPAYRKTQLA